MNKSDFIKKSIVSFALVLIAFICFSQDVKFSQYFSSQLTINPALCGIYGGKYRIQSNYRNQWRNIQYPYITGYVSAETQLQKENFQEDVLAVGVNALTDQSNNGGLVNNSFSGTISYHKGLDANNYSRIGAGLQFSYNTIRVDYSKMTFEPQFTADGYDINLPTNEPINGFSVNRFDFAAGLLYSYFSGDVNFYTGASVYHLNQSKKQYGFVNLNVPIRMTFHAGASFTVGEINTLYVNAMHMQTNRENQTTIGLVYGLNLNGGARESDGDDNALLSNELFIGTWLRLNDAVVPYLGLKMGNVQGGISYDITTSKVTVANAAMGGFEVSLNILLNENAEKRNMLKRIKCPPNLF